MVDTAASVNDALPSLLDTTASRSSSAQLNLLQLDECDVQETERNDCT